MRRRLLHRRAHCRRDRTFPRAREARDRTRARPAPPARNVARTKSGVAAAGGARARPPSKRATCARSPESPPPAPKQGTKIETHKVDIGTKKITANGESFLGLNPKGNVPALILPGGVLLNEGAACLQYIADLAPGSGLAPAAGTTERYVLQNVLSFLGTELHASFGPLFGPGTDEFKAAQKEKIASKLKMLTGTLGEQKFLTGDSVTVADLCESSHDSACRQEWRDPNPNPPRTLDLGRTDAYIIMSWSGYVGVDLTPFDKLTAFSARIAAHPKVVEAHAAMNSAA